METLTRLPKMESIRRTLGFQDVFSVDCVGQSGGLALLWKDDYDITVESSSRNHIDVQVTGGLSQLTWRLIGFYGCPESDRRRASWELLKELADCSDLSWLVVGDFNDIMHEHEKRG
ncbi:unnamed protein product [Cuscuta epithymum]|uniref:Endonuclease/exonuclease/phosphatase domain-containing protein n=1 Tax=Cuscuta epithymum TaxID=186058 RepID=A0AAV0FU57_9ASTE|nr:unnamed protein product [Cuscuta epithymum]